MERSKISSSGLPLPPYKRDRADSLNPLPLLHPLYKDLDETIALLPHLG